jgi:hypothetical protein
MDSPEGGLAFLQKGGYNLPDIARALKDYYGLTAGEAAKLLTAAYPNNQSLILSGLAFVYGQTLGATVAEALQEKGITDINGAIDYLWNAGFAPKEIAAGLGIYSADGIQSTVDQVYLSVGTSSGTLQQVLDLYGIKTAEGAVSLFNKQGTLDSDLISLVDLVDALQMADGGVLKVTYQIIKDISTRERQQFYDSLDSLELKLLDNNEIAMIVAVSALRNANISISDVTNQLKKTEVIEPENALKVLIVSGFNGLDSAEAVWDVYRDYIGAKIILKMFEKAAGQYITDFKDYYKLVMTLSKIVNKLSS